jgi:hypothetical protein
MVPNLQGFHQPMSNYRYNVSLSIGTFYTIEDTLDLVDELGESEAYLERLDADRLESLAEDYARDWASNYIDVRFSRIRD